MKALIFAAGLGTRLRPLTDHMPKALVPVDGVPMLERVIRKLQAIGYDEFVVNTHHFADQIASFLARNGNFGSRISISLEEGKPLETGGGIKNAAPLLCGEPFLVHNADILCDADLEAFRARHRADSLASLLVSDLPAERCFLFDHQMRLCGWMNNRTGEVRSPYSNFDPSACRKLSFCGIHVISDRIFSLMENWPEVFSITDFYLSVCNTQAIYGIEAPNIRMIDIGSPDKLQEANDYFSKKRL